MTSVSRQLVSQFAECLRAELAPSRLAPVGGISLLLRALWDRLLRLLRLRRA